MADLVQFRRGLAALWASTDPTPAEGELCLTLDTGAFKMGDGILPWSVLPYLYAIQDTDITITVANTPYTVVLKNCVYADASGGAITVNLPVMTGEKRIFTVVKTDASANAITVKDSAGTTLFVLTDQKQLVQFRTNGSDWYAL